MEDPFNPYQAPGPSIPADFRDEAVGASLAALAARPGVDPLEAGVSLCLEAGEDGRSALKRIGRGAVPRLVLGLSLLVAPVAALFWIGEENVSGPGTVGLLSLTVAGIVTLLSSSWDQRRRLRRGLRDRIDPATHPDGEFPPVMVEVEDSRTARKLKLAPEDVALVHFDPARRRLLIEGLSHRYIVRADDLTRIAQVDLPSGPALELTCAIGGASLSITLINTAPLAQLRAQTIGGRGKLFRRALPTLGLEPEDLAGARNRSS